MIDYKRNRTAALEGSTEYQLIDLCTMVTRSSDYYQQSEMVGAHEGAMILTANNIQNNSLVFDDVGYYSWKGYYERPRDIVEVGDILLVKMAAPGKPFKSAYVEELPESAITNIGLFIIKEIKCNPRYLQLVISSPHFQEMLSSIKNKGPMPAINMKGLYNLKVPMVSDEEQEKIVSHMLPLREKSQELVKSLNKEIQLREQQLGQYMDKTLWSNNC